MPRQTEKVKKALRPMPGACANGTLARKAVKKVPSAEARQVASISAF